MKGPGWQPRRGRRPPRLGHWALAGLLLLVVPGGLFLLAGLAWRWARRQP